MRRTGLLIAVFVMGTASAIGATLPALGQSKTTTNTFSSSIKAVVVRIDAGSVQIRPGSQPTIVTAKEQWLAVEPTVTESVDNGVLTVGSKCPSSMPVDNCSVEFTLAVPAKVTVDAVVDAGSIDVAQLYGSETLTSHAGSIDAASIVGRSLTAHTDSASVDLQKVRVLLIDASSNAGSVQVVATRAPKTLAAHSDSGSVAVTVPRGYYAIRAHSDSGSVAVRGLKNTPGAARSIVATTNAGSVSVRGA